MAMGHDTGVGRSHLSQWFDDDRAINVALTLKPGISPEEVRAELLSNHPGIAVRTQSKLCAKSSIFSNKLFL